MGTRGEHPTGKKVYEDDISMMPVDQKGKMLEEQDEKGFGVTLDD